MFGKCQYNKKLFRIAKEINATDVITKIIAFQPPKKALYTIEPLNANNPADRSKHSCSIEKVKFVHDTFSNISYKWIEEDCYTFKNANQGSKNKDKKLVILHLKNKNKHPEGFTILFSHGNASTLGTVYSYLIDVCTQLRCDVITYDYSGYGRSEGKSSEREIYNDIEEVGFFVDKMLNIPPSQIILMGHSLGSAPSVHLAITKQFREVRAVILLSPIASGVKLVSKDLKTNELDNIDVFCNIRKIIDVSCPIFLIHGQKDEVIPIEQSIEMAKYMKNVFEWHPRHGDHSNILTKYRTKFFQKCKFFFEHLNYYSKKQMITNSTITYNCSSNEKLYSDFFFNNPVNSEYHPLLVEESYYNQTKVETLPNGHIFSSNEKSHSFVDNFHINLNHNEKQENACININSKYKSTNKKCSLSNEYILDSNDIRSSDMKLKSGTTLSDNMCSYIDGFRDSKTSSKILLYRDQKEMEEQYNKMLLKHNGI